MVVCCFLDMVYIQNMMEEDQKEGTPGSLQPFLSFCILFWAFCTIFPDWKGTHGAVWDWDSAGRAGGASAQAKPRWGEGPEGPVGVVSREEAGAAPVQAPVQFQMLTNLPSASPDLAFC